MERRILFERHIFLPFFRRDLRVLCMNTLKKLAKKKLFR